jgi:hypothetical protein
MRINYFYLVYFTAVLLTHYFAGDKIEKNQMCGSCSSDGKGRGVYGVLVGKSETPRETKV